MRNRTILVLELIRNPRPDVLVIQELAEYGHDSDAPLAMVSRTDFISVLRQFESGTLSASELKAWANRLLGRRDIEFEFGQEGAVVEALFWLAYEEMQAWANNRVCQHIEAMLERRSSDRDAPD
jgi:hypothetical protein